MQTAIDVGFETISLSELVAMPDARRDALPFGAIGLDRDGIARVYNETESNMAGLPINLVVGAHFFETIAQCMNNFMVAQRFEDSEEVDEIVPFVLTLRMRPTPVRLRLLASASEPLRFVLIER